MAVNYNNISILKDEIRKVTSYEGLEEQKVIVYIHGSWSHLWAIGEEAKEVLKEKRVMNKVRFITLELGPESRFFTEVYEKFAKEESKVRMGDTFAFFKKRKLIGFHRSGSLIHNKQRKEFIELLKKLSL